MTFTRPFLRCEEAELRFPLIRQSMDRGFRVSMRFSGGC